MAVMTTQKLIISSGILAGFVAYSILQTPGLAEAIIGRIKNGEEHRVLLPSPTPLASAIPSPATQEFRRGNQAKPSPTAPPQTLGTYRDGTYTSPVEDAYYGNLQIVVTITGGKIADVGVPFLQYPNDRGTSIEINSIAMPYLKQEAISAQSANVQIISGATATSEAFRTALSSVLTKASL